MASAFGIIKIGLSSLGTRFGMGNEQSQLSQVDAESQSSQDEAVKLDKTTNGHDAKINRREYPMTHIKSPEISSRIDGDTPIRRKRVRKTGSGKRRLSNTALTATGGSITSDGISMQAPTTPALENKSTKAIKVPVSRIKPRLSADPSPINHEPTSSTPEARKSPASTHIKSSVIEGIKISPSMVEQKKNAMIAATPEKRMTRQSEARQILISGGRTRYPCPDAKKYNCNKTFSMISDAEGHAQNTHRTGGKLYCPVCLKVYPRGDMLKTHMATHSAAELRASQSMEDELKPTEPRVREESRESAGSESESSLGPGVQESNEAEREKRSPENLNGLAIPESVQYPILSGEDHNQRLSNSFEQPSSLESLQAIPDSEPLRAIEADIPVLHTPEESFDKASTVPDSGFDEPMEPEIVQETPKSTRTLKRRRDTAGNNGASPDHASPSKRPRRSLYSPPRSHSPEEIAGNDPSSDQTRMPKLRSLRSLNTKSGNLKLFAKPLVPGSQSYHPIHNPRTPRTMTSQRVEITLPRPSIGGPSGTKLSKKFQMALDETTHQDSDKRITIANGKQKSAYTSPKGKSRAEPNIDYSTPSKQERLQLVDDNDAEDENYKPERPKRQGMATSVAHRTSSQKASKKPVSSRKKQQDKDDDPSSSESDANSHSVKGNSSGKDIFLCQECRRKFNSLEALRQHERKPGVHKNFHECEECSAIFPSKAKLSEHELQIGHGDGTGDVGRKGHFSPGEINKLNDWRDRFCDEFDLDLTEFNQIMTDTCRRIKGVEWPHRFISKTDFLQQYFDVLPSRGRRSMLRYRERSFQNVPDNQKWTEEDDNELVNLVREIGPKWVEIGQRMTRTQDSVNQRWRHKLRYRGKAIEGEWLPQDTELLIKAVSQVRRESNLPLDPNADVKIPWDLVSNKLKGKRTAQQCSNKWRVMHTHKKDGKRIRTSGVDKMPNTPVSMVTPSKMSQRIAGSTPQMQSSKPATSTAKKRKYISDEIVVESSDELGGEESDKDDAEDDTALNKASETLKITERASTTAQKRRKPPATAAKIVSDQSLSDEDEDSSDAKSPSLPPNPLPARTPRNELSVSQLINQTQANTSALRSTTTARKETQPERPSPNIPIQPRPESSPLRMLSTNNAKVEKVNSSAAAEDESDRETEESDESDKVVEDEATEASATDDEEEGEEEEEGSGESDSELDSGTSDGESGDGSEEDSADEKDTGQKSFLQSLRSPPSQQTSMSGALQGKSKRIDFTKAVRGSAQDSSSEEESDSDDDDDEGDIMYK